MKITREWLKNKNACIDAVDKWAELGKEPDPIMVVNMAMEIGRFDWANWVIVRCMKYKQYVLYAIFAAEQVIDIFEKKYPTDRRPRAAIEAAKLCLTHPSAKNKEAADAAAATADAAYTSAAAAAAAAHTSAAAAAAAAADDTADAAYDAAITADAAAATADAAYTSAAATFAATYAAEARKEMQDKIINYGISLLEMEVEGED